MPRTATAGHLRAKIIATASLVLLLATGAATQAQTFTVLHSFTNSGGDGGEPPAGLLIDAAGNLYGTTFQGGSLACSSGVSNAVGCGTVFKLDPSGNETVLYSFTAGSDGALPAAGLIMDAAGNLYGTTAHGGGPCPFGSGGCGTAFKLDAAGTETVLHRFTTLDGVNPRAGLIMDAAGNLYGTAQGSGPGGSGTVFKLDTAGNLTVLHAFTGGSDGVFPDAALVMDAAGNLYGTTSLGGGSSTCGGSFGGCGIVFKLDPSGKETVLHSFTGPDGLFPFAGLIMDAIGNLYGTTSSGGASSNCTRGCGTVYKLDTSGNLTVLHSFTNSGGDGAQPVAGLILDKAGNLYGTTQLGGGSSSIGDGIVFRLDTSGNLTVLHSFSGIAGGGQPVAGLIMDSADNLYGTTFFGGSSSNCSSGCGTVFKLSPQSPVPAITSIAPTSATAGGAAFTLTVNGTGFVSTSVVDFGANARATTRVSSTQLTATISASDIATAGNFNVTVTNPTPGGGTSNAVSFTVNNPVPTVTSISPTGALAGGAAFTLTVNGTAFVSTSVVNYGGNVRATTQVSSTQLTAAISASDIATAGNFNVTVFNPPPGGGTSNAVNFAVTDFSIAVATGGSALATVTAGQTASYKLQVSPSNGFTGTVTLTCSGAPNQASCTPAPSSPAVNGIATPFTVNVTTTAPSIAGLVVGGPASAPLSSSIGVLLGLVMLMVLIGTNLGMPRPQRALAPVLALIALALLSGCGGGSPNPAPTPMGGTPKGTYTLTVTGSSGGANRTISLTLTVN